MVCSVRTLANNKGDFGGESDFMYFAASLQFCVHALLSVWNAPNPPEFLDTPLFEFIILLACSSQISTAKHTATWYLHKSHPFSPCHIIFDLGGKRARLAGKQPTKHPPDRQALRRVRAIMSMYSSFVVVAGTSRHHNRQRQLRKMAENRIVESTRLDYVTVAEDSKVRGQLLEGATLSSREGGPIVNQ